MERRGSNGNTWTYCKYTCGITLSVLGSTAPISSQVSAPLNEKQKISTQVCARVLGTCSIFYEVQRSTTTVAIIFSLVSNETVRDTITSGKCACQYHHKPWDKLNVCKRLTTVINNCRLLLNMSRASWRTPNGIHVRTRRTPDNTDWVHNNDNISKMAARLKAHIQTALKGRTATMTECSSA